MIPPEDQQPGHGDPQAPQPAGVHLPSLLVALSIMVAGSVYPLLFAGSDGRARHDLALLLFWAMSAGFVRGVGFVPRHRLARLVFSGWSCAVALALAVLMRWSG